MTATYLSDEAFAAFSHRISALRTGISSRDKKRARLDRFNLKRREKRLAEGKAPKKSLKHMTKWEKKVHRANIRSKSHYNTTRARQLEVLRRAMVRCGIAGTIPVEEVAIKQGRWGHQSWKGRGDKKWY